ncbi:MAG: hypothetical protein ACRBBO_13240 [Cognatishimia sp.]
MIIRNALCLVLLSALPASAQSLSAADILAQVDQKVSGLNEYQQLLNDPDPARSMAAMEIMLGSGDAALERMALDYGLYSPNPVVRRAALDAFFSTQPTLGIYLTQTEGDENRYWAKKAEEGRGSVLEDGRIFFSIQVGKFDDAQNCYSRIENTECRVRVSDTDVGITIWGQWHALKLNDQGELVGSGSFPFSSKPVKTVIQVGN